MGHLGTTNRVRSAIAVSEGMERAATNMPRTEGFPLAQQGGIDAPSVTNGPGLEEYHGTFRRVSRHDDKFSYVSWTHQLPLDIQSKLSRHYTRVLSAPCYDPSYDPRFASTESALDSAPHYNTSY